MKAYYCLTLALLISSSGCTSVASQSPPTATKVLTAPAYVNGNEGAELTTQQVSTLERQALFGDGKAAMRLRAFYAFWKYDHGQAEFWQTIALEDGDINAMLQEVQDLTDSDDPRASVRARYWLNIVSENPSYRAAAHVYENRLNKKTQ